ncbi:hypothetical protein XFF6166_840068 [Xanthomonas citri pv. fuscans]|nr:hypothetical protein XFF6166_840068 [Xanthomonas citri pv. fuscans]SON98409.1 hypothetical protein XFF7767_1030067 [Xanthomonas citri pv. fuscans]SOO02552.1 hypothetical protein XFF6960_630089 [Xanthomonas citri pv. fuscans]SOO09714.1 hypothetical protein XFF6970_440087 [Xanthomonas citri pv. fuscans]SOO12877.1 hypothetical protein XFF7766_1140068 [Xanthomonas citri pv. fuscans]
MQARYSNWASGPFLHEAVYVVLLGVAGPGDCFHMLYDR